MVVLFSSLDVVFFSLSLSVFLLFSSDVVLLGDYDEFYFLLLSLGVVYLSLSVFLLMSSLSNFLSIESDSYLLDVNVGPFSTRVII